MTGQLDLAPHGTTVEALRQVLAEELPLGEGDLLLACGSIAEGLGNGRSDLDLCLVTERAGPGVDLARDRAFRAGPLLCDAQFVHPATVAALAGRLRAVSGADEELRAAAAAFTAAEQRLLHRLGNAVPLLPVPGASPAYETLRALVPAEAVARHKLKQSWSEARALQLDLAGLRDAAEWPSLVFAAQDLLGWTLSGLLAAHGLTNPTAKWRLKLLERLPAGALAAIPGVDPAAEPAALALALNAAPAVAEPAAAAAFALRIAAFARSTFLWAGQRLLGAPPVANLFAAAAGGDALSEPLPALDLDVHCQPAEGGYELFRLNRAPGRLRLDPGLAALAALMDGRTTLAQAERACRERGLAANRVAPLAAALAQAGLTAPYRVDEAALQAMLCGS